MDPSREIRYFDASNPIRGYVLCTLVHTSTRGTHWDSDSSGKKAKAKRKEDLRIWE